MGVDLEKLIVPWETASTNERRDFVLRSKAQQGVYFVELIVPLEDAVEMAYERKQLR